MIVRCSSVGISGFSVGLSNQSSNLGVCSIPGAMKLFHTVRTHHASDCKMNCIRYVKAKPKAIMHL